MWEVPLAMFANCDVSPGCRLYVELRKVHPSFVFCCACPITAFFFLFVYLLFILYFSLVFPSYHPNVL